MHYIFWSEIQKLGARGTAAPKIHPGM